MNRATFFPRAPLGELLLRTATVILLSAAATAQATTDGLAISGAPPTVATPGKAYAFTPSIANPAKRALHFSISNKPAWATFNTSTGHLAGTPAAANVGTENNVVITVSDGVVKTYLHFYLTVFAPAADKPVLSGKPPTSATVGQTYSFTPTVSNPGKLALHFAISDKPAWATFNTSTGHLGGTPAAANAGTQSSVLIMVTDGADKAYLHFYLKVIAGSGTADKPVISGTPSTSVSAGSTYKFQPTAKDPAGKALSFSVKNKPAWASFSISSGLLDGTPTSSQNGTYGNIIISASNGKYSSALPAFSVTVKSATSGGTTGAATINWVPPTKNTNGSAVTGLAGIRIYYGTSMANLNHMTQVAGATTKRTTIGNLTAGTWYFGGVSYTTTGAQSAMSTIVSKYVP